MKTKFVFMLVIASLVFSLMPSGLCHASEPDVTREYISRKVNGQKSKEEKLVVNYENLQMSKEVYVRITFFNGRNIELDSYEFSLSVNDLFENKLSLDSEALVGTKYIEIDLIHQYKCESKFIYLGRAIQ